MKIEDNILLFFLTFLLAFIVTYISIPSIIRVVDLKNLYDDPDGDRRVHTIRTPTLGGLAIFAGISFSVLLMADFQEFVSVKYILAGMIVLFFIGIIILALCVGVITSLPFLSPFRPIIALTSTILYFYYFTPKKILNQLYKVPSPVVDHYYNWKMIEFDDELED